jgi:hypothetical protein
MLHGEASPRFPLVWNLLKLNGREPSLQLSMALIG